MTFKPRAAADAALELPIERRDGTTKTYTLAPLSAELGPAAQALFDVLMQAELGGEPSELDAELLSDVAERDFYRRVLGDAHDEMINDGVDWPTLKLAAMTVITDGCIGREAAERVWSGELGKANRATRRAASSVRARKSQAPASTGGTTSRRSTAKKAPARRPGRGSSTAGRS